MEKSREILGIRYIGLIVLLVQIVLLNNNFLGILIGLIIILNNNLRLFFIKSEKARYISIVLDIVFAILGVKYLGGIALFYIIGDIIDTFNLEKKMKYMVLSVLFVIMGSQVALDVSKAVYLVIMTILVILLEYINNLYETKLEAQKLYDKLRISEDSLKEANRNLETYALSIEELATLKERNRISREIHDSVGHTLSTAMIQLSAMEVIGKKEENSLVPMVQGLREFINESFQDVKKAIRQIKPEAYGEYEGIFKIQEVCKNFERMTGVKVNITVSKEVWGIDEDKASHLYRIIQEVLSNALRHGKATRVNVIVNFIEKEMTISFKDNGEGRDIIEETGVGLKSIKERTREMGGRVYINSKKGDGFFIKINIPKEKEIKAWKR